MKLRSLLEWIVLVIPVTMLLGCGGGESEVETVDVSGTVTLDGSPLEGAEVNLGGGEYAGVATTDASGRYELEAEPGENTVFIRKFEGMGADFDPTEVGPSDTGGGGGPKPLLPARYSHPEKTELTFDVPEDGTDEADFKLSSGG